MSVVLRPVAAADSDTILAWQQAPETRAYSRDPDSPTRARHDQWIAARLALENAPYMIVIADGQPAGVLRLDPVGQHGFEISILVAPGLHGRGIGKAVLKLARALRPAAELYAEILPGNTASDALFRAAGYISSDGRHFVSQGAIEPIIALHADGGEMVGLGHARRCVGLAQGLVAGGLIPMFFVRPNSGLEDFLNKQGFDAHICGDTPATLFHTLTGARALVVDSYRIDREALAALAANNLMLIDFDDTGDSHSGFDLTINGSPAAANLNYDGKENIKLLLGPAYQVVRRDLVRGTPDRQDDVKRLLVTLGGGDPLGVGPDIIDMLEKKILPNHPNLEIHFVVGPMAKRPVMTSKRIRLRQDPDNMAELISGADMAISGGGQTLFELLYCGVPTLALKIAENQMANLAVLAQGEAIIACGQAGEGGWLEILENNTLDLLGDGERRNGLAKKGMSLIDHKGADRVTAVIADRLKVTPSGTQRI